MRGKKISIGLTAVLVIAALTLLVTGTRVSAQTETVLFSFNSTGGCAQSSLIFDASGNLYGTNECGGSSGYGTVFELVPASDGSWKEIVLHNFNNDGTDGIYPIGPLIFDAAGNLYGSTLATGDKSYCFTNITCGTVFKLMPKAGGGWTEKVLHNFNTEATGYHPLSPLIFDPAGNLYGTTDAGGVYVKGTVFELTPKAGGGWEHRVLHNFGHNAGDGAGPWGVVFDASGNLYGTTFAGGLYGSPYCGSNDGCGVVFELSPTAGGDWVEKILYKFGPPNSCANGCNPNGGLILSADGLSLYGTTQEGGALGLGTVFELTSAGNGRWKENVLHSFGSGTDGWEPNPGLIFDATGSLYGTTGLGGNGTNCDVDGCGTVFKLTPMAGDRWVETILHNFSNNGSDGYGPNGALVFGDTGSLYGTTREGGAYNSGTMFKITP
jgi:uncharacterized repeat protein (TIGR03803 family)